MGILHLDPYYVLNDMSLEAFTLILDGHMMATDPDYHKKKIPQKEPDMETTNRLIQILQNNGGEHIKI